MTPALQAAAHWPQIITAPVLFMQRENAVYRVETTQGPHALRLHRPGLHSTQTLQSELDLMAMLSATMLVPTPAASATGALLAQVTNRHASLLSWLPGQPMGRSGQPLTQSGQARTSLFASIGREMARLHLLCDHWTPPPNFHRPTWDAQGLLGDQPLWGRFWDCGTPQDRQMLAQFRNHAQTALHQATDYGLIHADLVNENVLVHGTQVHFIDFDDSGYGFRTFDIATTLYKAVDEPDFPALQSALLQAYAQIRPLPDPHLLPIFIALRAATYLGWIAQRAHEPAIAAKAPTYLVLARRLIAAHLP